MAITVRQLIEQDLLPLTLRAGAAGLDREILWVHATDLPQPWQYLARSEALLTNGTGMTGDPLAQVQFVGRLDRSGASALGYGLGTGPPLSEEAVAEADRVGLPLFTLPRQTRFSALAQLVANGNATQQQRELQQLGRLYEVLHTALATHAGTAEVLAELGAEIGAELTLVHLDDGHPAMGSSPTAYAAEVVLAASQLPEQSADLVRLGPREGTTGTSAVMVPLDHEARIALVVEVTDRGLPSRTLLQHLATATMIELAQPLGAGPGSSRTSLLGELISGRLDRGTASERMAQQGLTPERCVVVAARKVSAPGSGSATYPPLGGWTGVRYLSTVDRDRWYVLVDPGRDEAELQGLAVAGWVVGVSQQLVTTERFGEAMVEAQWSAARAQLNDLEVCHFSDWLNWLEPRSRGDAECLVQRNIGALLEQDRRRATQYTRTLRVWMDHDRSWQRAADALGIHKQTLGYRLHRIEDLLGHGTSGTSDIVKLWLALRAQALLVLADEWQRAERAPGVTLGG